MSPNEKKANDFLRRQVGFPITIFESAPTKRYAMTSKLSNSTRSWSEKEQ